MMRIWIGISMFICFASFLSCADDSEKPSDNLPEGDFDAEEEDIEIGEIACYLLDGGCAGLTSWTCPDEWQQVTHDSLLDEQGEPFTWCEPPESWKTPTGPARLKSWDCPEYWTETHHDSLTDDNGESFSWCEPPDTWSSLAGPARLTSWDCPAGWTPVAHEELADKNGDPFTYCRPPKVARIFAPGLGDEGTDYSTPLPSGELAENYESCDISAGLRPVLWGTGCKTIGQSCPEGTFSDVPQEFDGPRVYVKAGSTAGDGSELSPYGNLAAAIEAAAAGSVLFIASGEYEGPLQIDKNLTLLGACVEQTVIRKTTPFSEDSKRIVTIVGGANVTLRNLKITGEGYGISVYEQDSHVDLQGVAIVASKTLGILVGSWEDNEGGQTVLLPGSLTATDLVVFATATQSGSGYGLLAQSGSNVSINDAIFEKMTNTSGAMFDAGTTVSFADTLFRHTLPIKSGNYEGWGGTGLSINSGATCSAERSAILQSMSAGIVVWDTGTSFSSEYLSINHTAAENDGKSNGQGINVATGGVTLDLKHTLIENNISAGIILWGDGSNSSNTITMEAESLVIQDTAPLMTTHIGYGLAAIDNCQVDIKNSLVERNSYVSFYAYKDSESESSDINVKVFGSDLVVLDTKESSPLGGGSGIIVEDGTEAVLNRVSIVGGTMAGLLLDGPNTKATVNDLIVRDFQPNSVGDYTGKLGHGVFVERGAMLELSRAQIDNCTTSGLQLLEEGSSATLTDVVVQNTQPAENYPLVEGKDIRKDTGVGLGLEKNSRAILKRVLLKNNHAAGLFVVSEGSTVEDSEDVVILDTELAIGSDFIGTQGLGINVQYEASVTMANVLVDGAVTAGAEAKGCDGLEDCGQAARLHLEDFVIRNILAREDEQGQMVFGRGIGGQTGSNIALVRGTIDHAHDIGIFASNTPVKMTLEDVAVFSMSSIMDGYFGRGIEANGGAEIEGSRVLVDEAVDHGIAISEENTSVILDYLTVRNTQPQDASSHFGRGISMQGGATATFSHLLLEENRSHGLFLAQDGTSVTIENGVIKETESSDLSDRLGRGIEINRGASAQLTNVLVEDNREIGIGVYGWDSEDPLFPTDPQTSSLSFLQMVIRNTRNANCSELSEDDPNYCIIGEANEGAGHGLFSGTGGEINGNNFTLSGSFAVGLLLAKESDVEIHTGSITENKIGINILDESFDLSSIEENVYNFNNISDFSRENIQIPDPTELIQPMKDMDESD